MANLKNRLAKKIDIIEADNTTNNNDLIKETSDNVILFNSSEDNKENNKTISIVPDFAITLNDARKRIEMLQSFVKEMMVVNVDYGFIPNCTKPSLFKSGGEKLCDIFGFSKQIEVINRVEDWEKALFHYEIKTTLINKRTGLIEAEGIGSCNNRERKYKTQDGYSIINNILKMAKKRAFIDAVLSATRSSGLFTQDMEDTPLYSNLPSENKNSNAKPVNKAANNKYINNSANISSTHDINNTNKKKYNNNSSPQTKQFLSKSQQGQLVSIIRQNNISINGVKALMKERYKVSESKYLSSVQADDFIKYLKIYTAI